MNRRNSGVTPIPEPVQTQMRERLRHLREIKGVHRSNLKSLSASTLTGYELHELSTFRLGDLYAFAIELGVEPREFLEYLFTGVESEASSTTTRLQRISVYLRSMPEDVQDLAVALVQQVVQHSIDERAVKQVARTTDHVDSRQLVREALAAETNGHDQ